VRPRVAQPSKLTPALWTEFAQRGLGTQAQTNGGSDVDPVPAFDDESESRNGTFTGKVVNASTGAPVKDAKVILGVFEGRVTALRTTSTQGAFSAPVVGGTYPVTIQARGFGAQTFTDVTVAPVRTTSLKFSLAPNLVSEANGAKVVSSTACNPSALLDDTEASLWNTRQARQRRDRHGPHGEGRRHPGLGLHDLEVRGSEGLHDAAVHRRQGVEQRGCEEGCVHVPDAASGRPGLHDKTFELANRVSARYVRFYADAPQAETKENVQVAELQVLSGSVKNVVPRSDRLAGVPTAAAGPASSGRPRCFPPRSPSALPCGPDPSSRTICGPFAARLLRLRVADRNECVRCLTPSDRALGSARCCHRGEPA
jgi:extracellular elastinolytic metalloproteinase